MAGPCSGSLAKCFASLLVIAAVGTSMVACGGGNKHGTTSTMPDKGSGVVTDTKKGATTGADSSTGCQKVAMPSPEAGRHVPRPAKRLPSGKAYTVRFATNCGTFDVQLDEKRFPKTTSSVASLVKAGFYDGLTFHLAIPGGGLGGGDPLGTGATGKKHLKGGPGYVVVEPPAQSLSYRAGDVVMQRGPGEPRGASGSQFFVFLAIGQRPEPEFARLGHVVRGLNVVQRLSEQGSTSTVTPSMPLVIRRATLTVR